MFKLFSREKPGSSSGGLEILGTDLHSHLLPGIDDGSPDMSTSVKLIKGMADLGYSKLITTPHIMWDMYRNTPEIIGAKLELLREEVKKEGIAIEINAAAEYFLDEHMEQLLKEGAPLLALSGKMILVEFSLAYPAHGLKDILFELQMQGYQPVIAHPERYIYLEHNKEFYEELKDLGCLFQLNLLALAGHYGRSVNELANYLVKKEYYDLVGTDLHHHRHLDSLRSPSLMAALKKVMVSGKIRNKEL